MYVVERQVHGYRQGHQLLASSIQLLKEDQSVIDRLSDVAGPLRPRELFSPYLTTYPLPGGQWFVLARTWQDLTVARAGCVRTLSLLIPMADWAQAEGLTSYRKLFSIDRLPEESDATQVVLRPTPEEPLPPITNFSGSELLEALFLEEAKPVVVLDAIDPDLIATRLLTAMWPSLRRRFAVSTFALSPRKVSGRDFDLVFAPKNARAKFADWNGRKVDGRLSQGSRHPWTRSIVSRVFDSPYPQLLSKADVALVAGNDPDIDNAAALRIALLWEELVEKLRTTPTAALGLLDIANSGKVHDSLALSSIEPSIADAAQQASATFPELEAWGFLAALARKLQGRTMPAGRSAVADAVEQLASRAPEGAITLLSQDDPRGIAKDLLPKIASGIATSFSGRAETALLRANPAILGQLLTQDKTLVERVANDGPLVDHLEQVLPRLDTSTFDAIQTALLPLLTEDWQIPAVKPLLDRLNGPQLMAELRHLGEVNNFRSEQLSDLVLERALNVASKLETRSALSALSPTPRRNELIARTLAPSVEDARWVVCSDVVDDATATTMLLELLRQANDDQFEAMLVDNAVMERTINRLQTYDDIMLRAVSGDVLPLGKFVVLVPDVLNVLIGSQKVRLAKHAIRRCVGRPDVDADGTFLMSMINEVGSSLDGAWLARAAFARNVDAATANRNMFVFGRVGAPARRQISLSIADLALALLDRPNFDLNEDAVMSFASLLTDAESVSPTGMLKAAGHLMPTLLRLRTRPVSPIIAVAFPPIHRELAKADDVPDLFRFIPFLDWDRCKAARNELVDAFLSSSWHPRDLALTACRADEVARIFGRVARQPNGTAYIKRIALEALELPDKCRAEVQAEISHVLD